MNHSNRLPITVISGYLGAGKTTLINRLLAEDHGLRLRVLINDFGAVNVDEALISARSDDIIALSNGCVCCTMSSDLITALETALDQTPRPDHLILEASGIADPAAIAQEAITEPELRYAGIITLVDAGNIDDLLSDPSSEPQVRQQINAADLVLVSKTQSVPDTLAEDLTRNGSRTPVLLPGGPVSDLLLGLDARPGPPTPSPHAHYVSWSCVSDQPQSRAAMGDKLANRPEGLYRFKGQVLTDDGGYEVHIVGRYVEARRAPDITQTRVAGLGLESRISEEEIEDWWTASA